MSASSGANDIQRPFPKFWHNAANLLVLHLKCMKVDDEDAEAIASDLIGRCISIEAILPSEPNSLVHLAFGVLWVQAMKAEMRLHKAKTGRWAGKLLDDYPLPIAFEAHPFLKAVQKVVSAVEAEANRAEGGKRVN